MAFSNLYSAVCRGKWFVSFREVESNLLLVNRLLEHGIDNQDNRILADREPVPLMIAAAGGRTARLSGGYADAPKGSTAIIPVHGTLLKYGTYCSYGTMEYADLIREAADSSNISSVLCDIDSGGGAVDAIAPLVDAILYARGKGKAVVAHCDLCASAAYYAASYCNEIIAANEVSAEFGSIGVMMSFRIMPSIMRVQASRCIPSIPTSLITRTLLSRQPRRGIMLPSVMRNWTRWPATSRRTSRRIGEIA